MWITRAQLFEEAWREPLTTVAARYGISSTALKKTCDRHDIPTPGRGYWAAVASGKTFARPKLRPAGPGRSEQLRIVGPPAATPARVAAQAATAEAAAARAAAPAARAPPVAASASGTAPVAPLAVPAALAATRKALARAKPDAAGFLQVRGPGVVGAKLGEASVERGLAVLGQLLAAAAGQGASARAIEAGLALVIDGEPIAVRLEELPRRTPHQLTAAERADAARRADWGLSTRVGPKYDHAPSGALALVIDGNDYSGLRRRFADGKTQDLEHLIPELLVALAGHAAYAQAQRREAEDRRRRVAAAQACRQRREAFAQREARRLAFAEAVAAALAEQAKLSAVLAHLQATGADTAGGETGAFAGWLRRRLAELSARLAPKALALSARAARVDFDEATARAAGSSYGGPSVALQLWAIDEVQGQATAQSGFDWACASGLVAPFAEETD